MLNLRVSFAPEPPKTTENWLVMGFLGRLEDLIGGVTDLTIVRQTTSGAFCGSGRRIRNGIMR